MPKFICLQAGHENTSQNCNTSLRKSSGAPGEAEFTVRVRDRLSQILIARGFQIQLVDACFNCSPENSKDFDLFLAIHYDADVYGKGGGFVGIPDASVDSAHDESKRIRDAIASEYFNNTGIEEHNERLNPNVTYYYMWSSLSLKTPCVLIECGVGQDPHDSVILADTDRVCNAIARGLCKAFNVPFDVQPPVESHPGGSESTSSNAPQLLLNKVKEIVYGKGWPWTKIAKLKEILK